jgi:hypothetical protein
MIRIAALACAGLLVLAGCASSVNKGSISDATGQPAGAVQATQETPTWGQRYTWPDGLAVEVAAPTGCRPGEYAMPQGVQRAVKFTITIVNGSDKPYSSGTLQVGSDAQFGGRAAEEVYDTGGDCGDGTGGLGGGTVLPGKSFTFDIAYAVGPQPGEMQLGFQPYAMADKAVFVGQV